MWQSNSFSKDLFYFRVGGWRERENPKGTLLSTEPNRQEGLWGEGKSISTLRSWPEPKSRVECLNNWSPRCLQSNLYQGYLISKWIYISRYWFSNRIPQPIKYGEIQRIKCSVKLKKKQINKKGDDFGGSPWEVIDQIASLLLPKYGEQFLIQEEFTSQEHLKYVCLSVQVVLNECHYMTHTRKKISYLRKFYDSTTTHTFNIVDITL